MPPIADRLRELLGAEDPTHLTQAIELLSVMPREVWFPIVTNLSDFTHWVSPLTIARQVEGMTIWDFVGLSTWSIEQVVLWEGGHPIPAQTQWDIAELLNHVRRTDPEATAATPRPRFRKGPVNLWRHRRGYARWIGPWFGKDPVVKIKASSLDFKQNHYIDNECDAPGCSAAETFRGYDEAGADAKARQAGWRLDPDRWCYCPRHFFHPPMGGPEGS